MNLMFVVLPVTSIDVPVLDFLGAVLDAAGASETCAVEAATEEYETPGTGVAWVTASTLAFASR